MAGILIYTASGDSEGTMGGLVRQGRSDTFPGIFKKAIESGMTCSNDPVCSLSLGQGRDSLNLAACYSCTLIPETSCEEFNIFLDRGTVVGTFNNSKFGFYCEQLYGEERWKKQSDSPKSAISETKNEHKQLLIPLTGTDVQDMGYSEIWTYVKDWSTNQVEIALIDKLISSSNIFAAKEKPYYMCKYKLFGEAEEYIGTLVWKKSKVIFFSSDDHDLYESTRQTDWTCFCGDDSTLTPEIIADALEEK